MDINEYLNHLSTLEQPYVVVIGKREVKPEDELSIVEMGRQLAIHLPNARFRTGNAPGSDRLFMQGIMEVARDRLELFIPFEGHLKKNADLITHSIEALDLTRESEIIATARTNPKTAHHVDPYLRGKRDRFTMKISYIFRDVWMVLGSKSRPLKKADAIFYYDDLSDRLSGGTGFTVQVALKNGIRSFNQMDWKRTDFNL